jgi:hypothetical protein
VLILLPGIHSATEILSFYAVLPASLNVLPFRLAWFFTNRVPAPFVAIWLFSVGSTALSVSLLILISLSSALPTCSILVQQRLFMYM